MAKISKKWLFHYILPATIGGLVLSGAGLYFALAALDTDNTASDSTVPRLVDAAYIEIDAVRKVMTADFAVSRGQYNEAASTGISRGTDPVQYSDADPEMRESTGDPNPAIAIFNDPDMVPLDRRGPYTYLPVDQVKALAGVISGTPQGMIDLQAYMDGSLGNMDEIRKRAFTLLDGLSNSGIRSDFIALAQATNRIADAAAESYGASYMVPFFLDSDFALLDQMSGWDLGPDGKNPYFDFTRIGPSDSAVSGTNMLALDADDTPTIIRDGLLNVLTFNSALPDGVYQINLLSSTLPNGTIARYPFGVDVRTNGQATRLIDASLPIDGETVFRLSGQGILAENLNMDEDILSAETGPSGILLAARAFVRDGALRIMLGADSENPGTYITAIIVALEDQAILQEQLAERIAALLNQAVPAAGPIRTAQLASVIADRFNRINTPPFQAPRVSPPPSSGSIGGPAPAPGNPSPPPPPGGGIPGNDDSGTTDGGTTDGGTTDGGTTDGGTTDGGTTDGGTTDGGTTDGGTTDGGTTDGGTTDGGTTDGGTTDGGTTDGGTTDGGTTDGGTTDGGTTDGGTTDGGTTDGGTTDGGTTDGGTTDGGTTDGGTTDGGTTDGGTTDGGTTDGGTTDGGTTDGGTTDGGTTDGGTTDGGTTDGGTTDGGTTDGGTTDGGTTDGGTTDGGTTDGGTTDGGTTDGGTTDGGTTDGGTTDGGTTDGGTTDGGTTDGGTTDGGTTDGGTTDGGTTDGGTTDGGTTDGGTTDGGTTDGGTTDGGTTDGGTTDGGTTDGGTTDGRTTDGGTTDGGTTDGGTTDGGTTDDLIAEAGTYDPIFLGDDLLLNGCGSTLNDDLVCLLEDSSQFTFSWILDDMVLGTGFDLLLPTGDSTGFRQPGDFLVRLELTLNGNPSLVSTDTALIHILDPRVIPVPATALLLATGLGYLGWRRRRRKHHR